MRKSNAYSEATRHVAQGNDEDSDMGQGPGRCHVFGCPLPGVFAETNGSMWFCACHDGIRGSDWHIVTNRIRNRFGAFDACFKVMTSAPIAGNWVPRAKAFLDRHGLNDLINDAGANDCFSRKDGQPISARKFFQNLHRALVAECRKDLVSHAAVVAKTGPNAGFVDIGALIG